MNIIAISENMSVIKRQMAFFLNLLFSIFLERVLLPLKFSLPFGIKYEKHCVYILEIFFFSSYDKCILEKNVPCIFFKEK